LQKNTRYKHTSRGAAKHLLRREVKLKPTGHSAAAKQRTLKAN
jgi:hypothetical protein